MINDNKIFKNKDNSKFYLIMFVILFIALIARVLFLDNSNKQNIIHDGNAVKAPIELSFSDVLRKSNDIKTMEIRKGDIAVGILKDGTPYRATITYNPELLEKISKNGATVSIDNSDSVLDMIAKWLPILVGALFFIWFNAWWKFWWWYHSQFDWSKSNKNNHRKNKNYIQRCCWY